MGVRVSTLTSFKASMMLSFKVERMGSSGSGSLAGAFSCSEWVRVKGTAKDPQYLVGVLYEDGKAKYICYALATTDKENPPAEIKSVCSFVPVSALSDSVGFFVIFQSATGGECIKPEQA